MISSAERKAFARDYFSALLQLPQLFRRLAFRRRTLEEELNEVRLGQRRLQRLRAVCVAAASYLCLCFQRPRYPRLYA